LFSDFSLGFFFCLSRRLLKYAASLACEGAASVCCVPVAVAVLADRMFPKVEALLAGCCVVEAPKKDDVWAGCCEAEVVVPKRPVEGAEVEAAAPVEKENAGAEVFGAPPRLKTEPDEAVVFSDGKAVDVVC
jgi:hypothetical protein